MIGCAATHTHISNSRIIDSVSGQGQIIHLTCAADGAQCDGDGFGPGAISCCEKGSTCSYVNQWYSKCVAPAPTCAADSVQCAGTGDHKMETIGCCDASESCIKWGGDWSVCRDAAHATCSKSGEQCAGTGASAMAPKGCCDPSQTCVAVNEYYSKCDTPKTAFFGALSNHDSCPGLDGCPTSGGAPKSAPVAVA